MDLASLAEVLGSCLRDRVELAELVSDGLDAPVTCAGARASCSRSPFAAIQLN